ncbi:class I SAM-dependent methyltransferase [Paenibacillus sp. RC67]|uniref:class I SAM-dependent methyltransferase n=1 Tax=Paenibacillus sp. RC67 TaxID=3039392 RepID=UPI0024AE2BFA|nr:class I SAM-dependent methyltransferase [Paenibacillus sp. RC67]
MSKKITPDFIMNQIRNGVRSQKKSMEETRLEQEIQSPILEFDDSEFSNIINTLQINLKRLTYRITPNMPVAFLEPHLVSRFKILGKIIIPIRRLGARLFTKWYADTFTNQQKHLNNDVWFGLNSTIEILNEQNKLILHLINKNVEIDKINNNFLELDINNKKLVSINEELQIINEKLQVSNNELVFYNKKLTSTIDALKIQLSEIKERTIKELETDLNSIQEMYKEQNFLDFDYSKFAERFSADRDIVQGIYEQYIPHLQECDNVLDIGCGRGYFLELLKKHNIKGIGVDSDPELVNACTEKGLIAYTDDAIKYLEGLEDSSVGGIFMAHVIEHLPAPLKIKFLKLCFKKLSQNGKLILETPNTTSPYVMHNLYYLDPTHEKPMFHETYKYIAVDIGFDVINSYLSGPIEETDPQEYYNFSLILSK